MSLFDNLDKRETAIRRASEWFKGKVKSAQIGALSLAFKNSEILPNMFIGSMFFYFYDPKHKETLPYYDRFPLVLPFNVYADGFIGLNLHYLHPTLRIKLLGKLYDYSTDKSISNQRRLALSWGLLNAASTASLVKPCVKRYLSDHVKSKFLNIEYDDWGKAVLLPLERFEKSSKQAVWADSSK